MARCQGGGNYLYFNLGRGFEDVTDTAYYIRNVSANIRHWFGGNVGIGMEASSYQFQLSTNSAAKPTSSTWTISSDRRIKEDIVDADLDTCLENVKKLKLKYYKLRDDIIELDPMFKDAHRLGWIAQEVEEVLPKCVTTIPEQYGLVDVKNLDTDQIYTNMFGAIQKLIKENEVLKVQLSSVLARLDALESA